MILIQYNTANNVVISLDEFASSTSYYLFSIYSEMQQKVVKNFVTSDIATAANRARFNKFTVTEVGQGGVEDLYAGKIRLPYDGTYLLKVYSQSSSGNIDPANGTLVFQDVAQVIGNPITGYQEYTGASDETLPYDIDFDL